MFESCKIEVSYSVTHLFNILHIYVVTVYIDFVLLHPDLLAHLSEPKTQGEPL